MTASNFPQYIPNRPAASARFAMVVHCHKSLGDGKSFMTQ
jgi:hypothetical protein